MRNSINTLMNKYLVKHYNITMVLNSLNSIFVHLILLTGSEIVELQILKLQEFLNNYFNLICCCLFVNNNLIGIKVRHNSEFVVSKLVVRSDRKSYQIAVSCEYKDHLDEAGQLQNQFSLILVQCDFRDLPLKIFFR